MVLCIVQQILWQRNGFIETKNVNACMKRSYDVINCTEFLGFILEFICNKQFLKMRKYNGGKFASMHGLFLLWINKNRNHRVIDKWYKEDSILLNLEYPTYSIRKRKQHKDPVFLQKTINGTLQSLFLGSEQQKKN